MYLRKKATSRYLVVYYYCLAGMCLLSSLTLLSNVSVFTLATLFKLILITTVVVTADKIISNRLDEPDEHLNDFAFFEFVTYVTYGSVMFAFIYYHYVFLWDLWFPESWL